MPTLSSSYFASDIGDVYNLVTPDIAFDEGDEVVVKAVNLNDGQEANIVNSPNGTGFDFTQRIVAPVTGSNPHASIWSARVTVSQSAYINVNFGGLYTQRAILVEVWKDAYIPADPVAVAGDGGGGPSFTTLDSIGDESFLTWCSADALGVDGSGRVYDTTSATPVEDTDGYWREYSAIWDAYFTAYFAYQDATTPGPQTFGLTAPIGQTWVIAALEIFHKEGTIIREATGVKAITGTTTIAPAYPAGVAVNRLAVAVRGQKPSTSTATTESGWDRQQSVTGGTGTQGTDTGPSLVTVDTRVLVGSESGTVTFDQASTPNSVTAAICIYSKLATHTWELASTTGDDTSHGTGRSATAVGTLALAPGDMMLAIWSSDTDSPTAYTSPTITATSITFGTTTNMFTTAAARAGSTTGQDANLLWFQATVTAGTATSTPVFSATGGPSSCGPVVFLRLREVPSAVNGTATPAVIARVVALPAATASAATDATATPAVTARLVGLPAATLKAGSAASPTVVARTVALPASTRTAGSTPTPATIARTAAIPAPAVGAGAAASPATIAQVAVLPDVSASGTGVGDATPNVIATTVTLPAATETGGGNVAPTVIPVAVALPVSAPRAGAATSPARILCAVTIPAATATSVTHATIGPAAIAAAAAVLAPTLTAGGAATPTVITLTIVVWSPTTAGIPDEHRRVFRPYRETVIEMWREPAGIAYREHP